MFDSPYTLRARLNVSGGTGQVAAIMENIWQFAKIYPSVTKATNVRNGRWGGMVWDHPAETRFTGDASRITTMRQSELLPNITDEYWAWRANGFANNQPVRYPLGGGKSGNAKCIGCLIMMKSADGEHRGGRGQGQRRRRYEWKVLDYITSRKALYVPLYCKLIRAHPKFHELRALAAKLGDKITIVDVDGPDQTQLDYYKR